MKMHKRLLLTYIDKYHRLDLAVLTAELRMTEWQITDMVSTLRKDGLVIIENQRYELSQKGKEWAFPIWNEWSVYNEENAMKKQQKFQWDYLYIPENMI